MTAELTADQVRERELAHYILERKALPRVLAVMSRINATPERLDLHGVTALDVSGCIMLHNEALKSYEGEYRRDCELLIAHLQNLMERMSAQEHARAFGTMALLVPTELQLLDLQQAA